ncbi:MAG: adenylate/guanylate cyclase domain-containing protein, partial [Verrucomicrobiales bacterium]|nr:adenylate/guanylate cyclase domain-containing protein [Verrucomicrobiales bacterium]
DPEVYNVASNEVRLGNFDFFRLASTASGLLHPPEDSRAGMQNAAFETQMEKQLNEVAGTLSSETTETQLGFLALNAEGPASPQLFRVLALPIRKFDTTMGLIFLGQEVKLHALAGAGEHALVPFIEASRLVFGEGLPAARPLLLKSLEDPSTKVLTVDGRDYRVQQHLLNPGSPFPPATLVSLFPLTEFQQQQRALMLRVLGIGIVALLAAAALAFAFAGQLSRPIHDLVAATRAVRGGDLAVRLPETAVREFGALNASFNEMTEGLALKERYHSVLSMVTDAQVAEQLMSGKIQLGGEAREVSILFCDIRGYTAMTVGRDPAEVIAILNQHMGALTQVVYRWHGVITQFAGDAVMVVFGAPTARGNDAENAVRCAWEMLAARESLNRDSPLPLGIGIGVASGPVVAGCIGAENRADYTVVGERVNLAARLCSVAGAGEVVVDETTRGAVPPSIQLAALPEPLNLKGFAGGTLAYRVTDITI